MAVNDQIKEDLSIFFDLEEMAELHKIKLPADVVAREITVIVDDDQLQQNGMKSAGTYEGNLLIFVNSSDVSEITKKMLILFDGVPYQVAGLVDEDGMTQITLSAGMGGF